MTKSKTQPAPADAVADAESALVQRTDELAAIQHEIAAAEAALPALAQSDDDTAFESASLALDRLKRSELRASKRLEAAREAHAEAVGHEEHRRQHELYSAGLVAAAEAARLASEYATHASAIAEILRKIDKRRRPVEAANADLPEGERTIDSHAFEIYRGVELPAAEPSGEAFWWRDGYGFSPLNPPPKRSPGHILIDGVYVQFDETNPAHRAALNARPSQGQPSAPKPAPQKENEFGERTLDDGTRRITFPPNEWPPRSSTN